MIDHATDENRQDALRLQKKVIDKLHSRLRREREKKLLIGVLACIVSGALGAHVVVENLWPKVATPPVLEVVGEAAKVACSTMLDEALALTDRCIANGNLCIDALKECQDGTSANAPANLSCDRFGLWSPSKGILLWRDESGIDHRARP